MDVHGFITQEDIFNAPVLASEEGFTTQTVQSWELQARGGSCPVCGKAFVKNEVDNRFGRFYHFIPGCWCFQICVNAGGRGMYVDGQYNKDAFYWRPGCNKILIEERLRDSRYCFGCGGEIPLRGYEPKIDWDSKEKVRKY
jgi:hypothetical protein